MSPDDEAPKEMTWEDHWAAGITPWDAGAASPALTELASTLRPPAGARALVPGCGSGYDVFLLAQSGFHAVGLDLAPSARSRFEQLRLAQSLNEERSVLRTEDFFQTSPAALGGTFDFVWDYTFYCAIDPSLRDAYKSQLLSLLAPGGTLAMLIFPVIPGAPRDQGPPYPLDPEEVAAKLSPDLARVALLQPHASHPGREGKEWLALFQRASRHH
jgi:SAM-dependent methyltransferase